jgi:glutamate racemase
MLGIFDSGFGGLTVLKSIHKQTPSLSTVYLGDNARAPYGDKDKEAIYEFTRQGVEFLFKQGCPLVILACNTASAQALRRLQQTFLPAHYPNHRILGVTRPTVEYLADTDEAEHLGIFGTKATITSDAYGKELKELFGSKHVLTQIPCPGLVELVEEGLEESAAAQRLVQTYTNQLLTHSKKIKRVLLACTHYPLLKDLFVRHLPETIEVLTQGEVVATSLVDYLQRHPEITERIDQTSQRYYSTTKIDNISGLATKFYGEEIVFESDNLDKT